MQTHSAIDKQAEAFYSGGGRGGMKESVVCASLFPAFPTSGSVPGLFCGTSRFWRTCFEKQCHSKLPTLITHFVVSASQGHWTRKRHWYFCVQAFCTENASGYQPRPFFKQSLDPKVGHELQRADFIERWHRTAPGLVSGCLRAGKHPWPALLGPR